MMHETEQCWLTALRHDTTLSVPEPVQALDGTFIQKVGTSQLPEGRIVTLLRWIPGQPVGKHRTTSVLLQLGASMAQLHRHAEQFVFPPPLSRPQTEWNKLLSWQDSEYDTSATLTAEQRAICSEASQQLLIEIAQIGTATEYGLIHADLTFENCLLDHGELSLIDFAECRYASHFYDMAVPLAELHDPRTADALRAAFFTGYSSVRPLGERYEGAIETFIVARAFDVLEWIHLDWPSVHYHAYGPELLQRSLQTIQRYLR
jgi:Ser/Thr protein kinase RdoA (MazF antagonist)